MKIKIKTLLLLLALTSLTLTSCKKKADNDQSTDEKSLNPPSWIQYTWTRPDVLSNDEEGYKFTSDDMYTVAYDQNGNQTYSESLMESLTDEDYTITEQKTSDSYQFTVHINDPDSTTLFQFNLLPSGELQSMHAINYTKKD